MLAAGTPYRRGVDCSDHCWGLEWPFWPIFFAKCIFYMYPGAAEKNWATFFLVLPPETALFSERVQISGEVVPISREGVLHSFLMPRCMGCSEINNINRHIIVSLLALTVLNYSSPRLCWCPALHCYCYCGLRIRDVFQFNFLPVP